MRLVAPRARLPCPRTQELLSSEGPQSQAEPPATRFAERFPSSAQSQGEPLRHREALGHASIHTECQNIVSAGQRTATSVTSGGGMGASCLHAGLPPSS